MYLLTRMSFWSKLASNVRSYIPLCCQDRQGSDYVCICIVYTIEWSGAERGLYMFAWSWANLIICLRVDVVFWKAFEFRQTLVYLYLISLAASVVHVYVGVQTGHTTPCLSKRRESSSLIDLFKKQSTLVPAHLLLIPNHSKSKWPNPNCHKTQTVQWKWDDREDCEGTGCRARRHGDEMRVPLVCPAVLQHATCNQRHKRYPNCSGSWALRMPKNTVWIKLMHILILATMLTRPCYTGLTGSWSDREWRNDVMIILLISTC